MAQAWLTPAILSALVFVFFKGRGVYFFNQTERLAIAVVGTRFYLFISIINIIKPIMVNIGINA